MPYTPPKVYYSATLTGTYTELTGIQSINITRGRQRATDAFSGSTCVIEIIPATSYAVPLAIGQFLDIRTSNSGTAPCFYSGRITDVQRRYDIPYNNSTGAAPADRITLTVSGGTGVIGSQVTTGTTFLTGGEDVISEASSRAFGGAGVTSYVASYPGVYCSSQTISAGTPLMTTISQLVNTAQWVIDDGDQQRLRVSSVDYACTFYPQSSTGTSIAFVDDGTTGFKYSGIEYLSSLQTSFTSVIVEPEGLAPQSASNTGTLRNSLVLQSYDQTTTQAAGLASYVLTVSQQTTPAPFVIQSSTAVSDTVGDLGQYMTYPVGTAVTVKFRGSTVYATVQGWSFGYYPDMATVQVFLSPSLGTPFTLDSTAFGVLDTNRLGYP